MFAQRGEAHRFAIHGRVVHMRRTLGHQQIQAIKFLEYREHFIFLYVGSRHAKDWSRTLRFV